MHAALGAGIGGDISEDSQLFDFEALDRRMETEIAEGSVKQLVEFYDNQAGIDAMEFDEVI